MAGIYIHIPFCKKACNYCNFHFSTSLKLQQQLVNALVTELIIRKDYVLNDTGRALSRRDSLPNRITNSTAALVDRPAATQPKNERSLQLRLILIIPHHHQ